MGLLAQTNDTNLIDITTLEQLDVIRYDVDGNGMPTSEGRDAYEAAFNISTDNRCLDAAGNVTPCQGYELMNDLDFKKGSTDPANFSIWAEGSTAFGSISSGWIPIGSDSRPFLTTFNGNGHTISNLYIKRRTGTQGLFGVPG